MSLPGDLVKLTIHDEGVGISEENLSKIFNPYFTTEEGGSGLGLTTVHSIIVKHHGAIGVDSELGVGTTFTIHLPAINSTSQDIASFNSNEPEHRQSVSAHILVVDDEEAIRQLSSDMLKSFGHSVITAGDGEEAIEKYIAADKGNDPFDVVIMDLTIPGGMGGKPTQCGRPRWRVTAHSTRCNRCSLTQSSPTRSPPARAPDRTHGDS